MNTMYDEINPRNSYCFIGEFRKNQECAKGIDFDDLKSIVSQLNLTELPKHEKYKLTIEDITTYNNHNLNINEYQSNIKKYIFSEGLLSSYTKSTLSGVYLLITISGYDNGSGEIIAYIFYEKQFNS